MRSSGDVQPQRTRLGALSAAIDKVVPSDGGEDVDALRRLAEFVEQKAVAIGAIEPNDA